MIYADGKRVASIPAMTADRKLNHAIRMMVRFRHDESLYRFWRNVYNYFRRLGAQQSKGEEKC